MPFESSPISPAAEETLSSIVRAWADAWRTGRKQAEKQKTHERKYIRTGSALDIYPVRPARAIRSRWPKQKKKNIKSKWDTIIAEIGNRYEHRLSLVAVEIIRRFGLYY